MDHLIENEGKPIPDLSSVSASSGSAGSGGAGPMDVDDADDEDLAALKAMYGKKPAGGSGAAGESSGGAGEAGGAEAKSIRCSLCGKTFKNVDLANYHAEKSGHDQFEESTEEVRFRVSSSLSVLGEECIPRLRALSRLDRSYSLIAWIKLYSSNGSPFPLLLLAGD